MKYKMEELIPIVSELARKYAGCDSTSVTYEKAQQLMAGVIYCLDEYEQYKKNQLAGKDLSVNQHYQMGRRIVFEKVSEVREIFNEMSANFDDYDVEFLNDTIQKGIPEFLKWYDPMYCPQDTILTLDYPLLKDIHSLHGVDAIHTYILAVKTEQEFLKKFDRNYVVSTLKIIYPSYKQMTDNVSGVILVNTIGHVALGKPFRNMGFEEEEYEKLSSIFSSDTIKEVEVIVRQIIEQIIVQIYEDNKEMLEYLCCDANNIAVRIHTAVRNSKLDKLFIQ